MLLLIIGFRSGDERDMENVVQVMGNADARSTEKVAAGQAQELWNEHQYLLVTAVMTRNWYKSIMLIWPWFNPAAAI